MAAPVQKRLKLVDDTVDLYTQRLAAVARTLQIKITALLSGIGNQNQIVDVALARAQIQTLLEESGYYQTGSDLFGQGYQDLFDYNYNTYTSKLGDAFKFQDVSAARLNAIKDLDFQTFNSFGARQVDTLQKIYLDLNFGATTYNQAIDLMRSSLEEDYQRYANTFVQTSVNNFERQSSNLLAVDSGIEYFEYAGPAPERPFCQEHYGEIKTFDEWQNIVNDGQGGTGGPVTEDMGGYRCTHFLAPVLGPNGNEI